MQNRININIVFNINYTKNKTKTQKKVKFFQAMCLVDSHENCNMTSSKDPQGPKEPTMRDRNSKKHSYNN